MPRVNNAQLSIRSAYARARAHEIARRTGMTATEVIEDALRGYVPPTGFERVGSLVQRGPVLVKPADGRRVTQHEADAALEAVRRRDT